MSRPRIVVLTSRMPFPLDKGDKRRIYHQLEVLITYFEVHLICLSANSYDRQVTEALRSVCAKLYVFDLPTERSKRNTFVYGVTGVLPLQVAYFYDRHIKTRIIHLLKDIRPHFVHCHLVRMAPYVVHYNDCPKSIDFMDSMVLNDLAGQYLSSGYKVIFKT